MQHHSYLRSRTDKIPRLSYRLRKLSPQSRAILNEVIYIFSLKGSNISEGVLRANTCSTCQQRLRRAYIQYSLTKTYGRVKFIQCIEPIKPCKLLPYENTNQSIPLLNKNFLLSLKIVDTQNNVILLDLFDKSFCVYDIFALFTKKFRYQEMPLFCNNHFIGKLTTIQELDCLPSINNDITVNIGAIYPISKNPAWFEC
ncbi:hypothetical protein BB558_002470 [Smittium angustum]|uniref:Uncharacterized protein n=1 Tax=Smittium angustum TaxID=133377 RepID=A0A2U1J8Q4_SMIAN|nr:hypothetical protein BB558_004647 [Smittium angustum]PWA01425.1 hypothetical protein BB558_002470 [Smittium angustum]